MTIDLESKKNLFWEADKIFELNEIGKLMEKIILEIPIYYSGILIDEYIIMPNHIHLIININKGRKWDSARTLNQKIVGADPCIRPINNFDSNIRPNKNNDSNIRPINNFDSNIRPINNFDSNIRPINNFDSNIRPNKNNDSNIRPNNQINSNLSLSEVIQRFKILSTNQYIKGIKHQNWPRFFKRLWQRNYYERIIRNEAEYLETKQYIKNNPVKLVSK